MCLYTVERKLNHSSGIGYKVFRYQHGRLYPAVYNSHGDHAFSASSSDIYHPYRWYNAIEDYESSFRQGEEEWYTTGFHIFPDYEDCYEYKICRMSHRYTYENQIYKVEYRNAFLEGTEKTYEEPESSPTLGVCILAKQMKILTPCFGVNYVSRKS